jgi:tetratricopeptide (TPR) repeat protein
LYRLVAEGGACDLRALLTGHPELREHRSLVIDALYEEYCRRLERGEQVDPDAFCDEFPSYRKSLRHALEVHHFADEHLRQLEAAGTPDWPEPGSLFLGYCLVRELGRGSFARVFLATEPALGNRPVVVKISQRGAAEAQTLGRLTHPGIVPVHSAQEHPASGLAVVCMPYLGSATLCDVVDRAFAGGKPPAGADLILEAARGTPDPNPPAPDAVAETGFPRGRSYTDGVVSLAAHLAEALAFTHARGVCHRDLKPSNVLVTPAGRPMLLDFNLSADAEAAPVSLGGTLPYMAPEQLCALETAEADGIDARADLFAFGVLLYELLTGRHPFGPVPLKLSPTELRGLLLGRHSRGCTPLREASPGVERWLAALVDRCLAYRPEDRPHSAAELAARLRWGLSWRGRLRRRLTRHGRPAAAVAVVVLALAGAGAWQLRPLSPAEHRARALAAYRDGDYQRAADEWTGVIEAETPSAESLYRRARAYQKMGDIDAAVGDYQKADRVVADPVLKGRINACLAYGYGLQKDYPLAVAAGKRALVFVWDNAGVHNNLGLALLLQNRLGEAAHHLNQAVFLNPDLQQARYNRALLGVARWPTPVVPLHQSLEDIETARRLGPVSAQLDFDAARIHAAFLPNPGHKSLAIDHLRKALRQGLAPKALRDPWFDPLRKDTEFRSLARPTDSGPPNPPLRITDPFPDASD